MCQGFSSARIFIYLFHLLSKKIILHIECPHQRWGSWWANSSRSSYMLFSISFTSEHPCAFSTDESNVFWGRPLLIDLSSLNNSLFVTLLSLLFSRLTTYFSCWLLIKSRRSPVLQIRSSWAFEYLKLHPPSFLANPPFTNLLRYPNIGSIKLG